MAYNTYHSMWPSTLLIRKLIPPKIATKLALIICTLVVSLLALLGFALTATAHSVLKINIQTTQMEIARRVGGEVAVFLRRPIELLESASHVVKRLERDSWNQETVLVELSLQYPMFEQISLLDAQGNEITTSNPGHEKNEYKTSELFLESQKGKPYISSIFHGEDHMPRLWVAIPYFKKGSLDGILAAKVNLSGLWNIVDSIRVGRTGRAILLSTDGFIIAHSNRRLVLQNVNLKTHKEFEDIDQITSKGTQFKDSDGKTYLASFVRIESPIPLGVLIQMETDEAYRVLAMMQWMIWGLILVSVLVSIGVSFWIGKRLVAPIKSLQSWSKKIAIGNLDYELKPASSDEIGRLFITFRKMNGRLKMARDRERLAAIGEAATIISHKLKNAIVALKTFAQLLPQRRHDQSFMQRFEEKFTNAIHHLEKLFKNLSQVTSVRQPRMEPLYLPTFLDSIKDSYQEIMERNHIEFIIESIHSIPMIRADREQLREVFVNVIQNAIQAMPEGGTLRIMATYDEASGNISILVKDTGVGIDSEVLSRIFSPFYTTKAHGMGLGLAISKKIIEDHFGMIKASSQLNHGTEFQIQLPVLSKRRVVIEVPR